MAKKFNKSGTIKNLKTIPLSGQNEIKNKFILGSILVLTIFLFAKSIDYYFVTWDDPQYLIENDLIRDLSFKGLINIFTTPVIGMYNPITFLVYSVVYKFFGLDPNAYHALNVFLHLLVTFLAFQFIFKLTKRYETAAIVALLFAIHPMHVSVAVWVSQTKTSLCAIFYFLSLISYIKYLQNNYTLKYLIYALLFFILGVLSKPDAVTLTPLFFLIDYYFTRKLERKLLIEKIPFFILSLFFGILTIVTHSNEGDSIFNVNKDYTLLSNLLVANYSVVFYFEKLFLPLGLSAIYPYPEQATFLPLKYYLSIPVIPALLILIYKAGRFRKEIVFGVLFFTISISVLLRIIPGDGFMTTNRYSYISYTGFFFIIGQFVTYTLDGKFSNSHNIKKYVLTGLFIFLIFFLIRSNTRISKWKNSIALYDDVLLKYPKVFVAYNNRGFAKAQMGDNNGAYVDYNTAVDLDPNAIQTYFNRALLLRKMEKLEESIADLNKVIEMNPEFGQAYFFRGLVKKQQNKTKEALADFTKAMQLEVPEAEEQIELLKSGSDE